MKKGLLLIIAVFLSVGLFAQNDLFVEDFEGGAVVNNEPVAIAGWNNFMEAGTRGWNGKEYSQNFYAQATAYGATNPDATNVIWLVTPVFDFSTSTNEVFSFDVNVGYYTHAGLQVYYSTNFDGSNVAGATWTEITSSFTIPTTPTDGYGTLAPAGNYDASAINSSTVAFAFKYSGNQPSSQTTTYQVDNVKITGTGSIINSISENSNTLSVYPNPVKDVLNITEKANVQVMNVAGQVVIDAQNVNSVDMSALTNGMYIVRIETAAGVQTEKIMKN